MAKCNCGSDKIKLTYSCSGAANTGYLSDSISRKLKSQEISSMTCLAGLGANLSGFIESAKCAEKNIVIDGCPVACGKHIFDNLKLPYEHFILTEYGVEKGKTVITEEIINKISAEIAEKI